MKATGHLRDESTAADPGQPPTPHVVISRVCKRFVSKGQEVVALEPTDFSIARGEFFCIVGPSGCGKTTLLRILAGLDQGSSGSIEIRRAQSSFPPDPRHADPRHGRSGVRPTPLNSLVFQEHSIFPWMTVRDNIAFGLKARGMRKRERYALADALIAQVQLTGFETARPHQLSGGMKQRVAIARALANDPEILLMDEPFASLDAQTKLTLQSELISLWEASRKTVVFVTHSIDEALLLGDRVMVMTARPGRVKAIIDVTEELGRPRNLSEAKASPTFGRLFARVWKLLQSESAEDVASTSREGST